MKYLLVLCLALSACVTAKDRAAELPGNLIYFKDPSTDLCFAYAYAGSTADSSVLAQVPCEKLPPESFGPRK